jgi:tripartite-type tricarboxylate transporter receptor subunit TctC
MSRIFVMPPGVPDEIYEAWKSAFEATTRDPGFRKAAEVAGYEVGLATAEDFYKTIRGYEGLGVEARALHKELIGAD